MSTLDPLEERAAAAILVEATDPSAAADDAGVAAFLQSCADLLGREAASIMDLSFRRRLEDDEISTQLAIPVEWVSDQVRMLPSMFGNVVRSRILWYGGQPQHDELASHLAVAGGGAFDATTSRTILAHARICEICDGYTAMHIEPIAAFSETDPLPTEPEPLVAPGLDALIAPHLPATTTSPAAERIAAATAAGSAAAAAAAATAGTSLAPQYTGLPSAPPPPAGARLAPISGVVAEEEAKRKKRMLIGGIVGAVVILLVVGFLVFRGGSGSSGDLAASGPSPTTVENKVYQSTSSTAYTPPTTRAPTTTTTEAPIIPDSISATINGGPSANVPQGFPTGSANLAWVTTVSPVSGSGGGAPAPPDRRVQISGAGITQPQQPETGSIGVCPSAEPDLCNVVPGTYEYTVTLFVNDINMGSAVVTLTVDPPPPPPAP